MVPILSAVIRSRQSVRSILDDVQAVTARQGVEGIQIARLTRHMNRDNGAVLAVIRRSASAGSILKPPGTLSHNTGRAPK